MNGNHKQGDHYEEVQDVDRGRRVPVHRAVRRIVGLLVVAVCLLAAPGCAILIPIAKVLAIPIAQHILDSDDKNDKDESKDDHEDEKPKEIC